MGDEVGTTSRLALLFTPGERLGWVFRDRWQFYRPFNEPAPSMPPLPPALLERHRWAKLRLSSRILLAAGVGGGACLVFLCAGACIGIRWGITGKMIMAAGVLALTGSVAAIAMIVVSYLRLRQAVHAAQADAEQQLHHMTAYWHQRRSAYEAEELRRVDEIIEWGAARTSDQEQRVDIIGGTLWGWEALLTVFGSSMMATRGPLMILDLSGEAVCAELVRLSEAAGVGLDVQPLPLGLETSDLLVGLGRQQFIDSFVEAMHSDHTDSHRSDRAIDERILQAICEIIGHDLTIARLWQALRTLMNEPATPVDSNAPPELTDEERRRIADDLFSDEYRQQTHNHLRRMESHLHPLRGLGTRRQGREPGFLTCITMDSDGRNVRNELLADLIIQWTTRRLLTDDAPQTLIIAGADDLQRRHLERLSDICERRGIRLALMFRHLRDSSLHLLGAGAVGFMRLGNHEEATRAADFVGRQHKFVLSQLAATLGGNETHSETHTDGYTETESLSIGENYSRFKNWSRGETSRSGSKSKGRSYADSRTRGWSMARNWSTARTWTEGTNWSNSETHQRVYEYTVEPTALQRLPDHAMLLVDTRSDNLAIQAVEVDPSIITLPRSSPEPLPDMSAVTDVPAERRTFAA